MAGSNALRAQGAAKSTSREWVALLWKMDFLSLACLLCWGPNQLGPDLCHGPWLPCPQTHLEVMPSQLLAVFNWGTLTSQIAPQLATNQRHPTEGTHTRPVPALSPAVRVPALLSHFLCRPGKSRSSPSVGQKQQQCFLKGWS